MVTATKVELYGNNQDGTPRRYTVADGTGITKNKILTLSDPRTAAEVSATPAANGYVCAGISSMEKEASDGSTSIAAWTDGVFEMSASGSITVGQPVKSCGTGYVMAASYLDIASGVIMGNALETASDKEVINVRVKI